MVKPLDQCIVMPLKTKSSQDVGSVGPALHFLLGNVITINHSLGELWFGWRVKKLFADASLLMAYCTESAFPFSVRESSREQKVRYWVHGVVGEKNALLTLYDAEKDKKVYESIPYSCEDHLAAFRSAFIEWLESAGIPWTDQEKETALWKEACDMNGLDAMGKALMGTYTHSFAEETEMLMLSTFKEAVRKAPEAFMAHDLLGWALYRNRDYGGAIRAFKKALNINPGGAGAMSGLMWCCTMTQDEAGSIHWAQRKASVCSKDSREAKEKTLRVYQKYNSHR